MSKYDVFSQKISSTWKFFPASQSRNKHSMTSVSFPRDNRKRFDVGRTYHLPPASPPAPPAASRLPSMAVIVEKAIKYTTCRQRCLEWPFSSVHRRTCHHVNGHRQGGEHAIGLNNPWRKTIFSVKTTTNKTENKWIKPIKIMQFTLFYAWMTFNWNGVNIHILLKIR